MHYYQFNLGDYAAKTQHLDEMEDLAYRRMIDLYMRLESPLPNDEKEIARLIRMRSHTESISNVLRDFFELTHNGYVDQSLQDIVDKYKEKSYKAKKSAEARWKKESPVDRKNTDANALETQCEGNANHKPITNNQEPITKNHKTNKKLPSVYTEEFETIWKIVSEGYKKTNDEKGNKIQALKSWNKLNTSEELKQQILTSLDKQIKDRINFKSRGFEVSYAKHFSTWINQRGWEDEVVGRQPRGFRAVEDTGNRRARNILTRDDF